MKNQRPSPGSDGHVRLITVPIGYCAAPRSIAIQLDVRDSLSGAGLADGATGTVATMSYQDSLHHITGSDSTLWGGDQLGTYTVTVRRASYTDWTRGNVVVSQTGRCGNVIPVGLVALLVRAPGVGPPETRFTFSFEKGMEGWTTAAADTGSVGGAYAPWSIQPSTDLAYDGQYSLKFSMANYTDAAKIWIVRPFPVTPGRAYVVQVSYAFGTADWGDANLFVLLTGTFNRPPFDGPTLLVGTAHEATGNGASRDVGYQWLRKSFRLSARGDASGVLYVVVGVWGPWEGARTYYIDDLTIQLFS